MSHYTFFDLESSPLPVDQLEPLIPEFVPDQRLKDPDKIAASIAEKREAWLSRCALSATTGRIISASIARNNDAPEFICAPDERTMIDVLIHDLSETIALGGTAFGWNSSGFDLPFLAQRAAAHGIPAFKMFTTSYRGRYSWNEAFVDVMQVWCGPYNRPDGMSLKNVALALGVGVKSGSGADFADLLKNDPVKAREYALNDVALLRNITAKMGLAESPNG
jgi:DNA polymerase elongation subunit (family B)